MSVSLYQGVAVIVSCGALGGIGHGLVTGIIWKDRPVALAIQHVVLGIIAALIAFGVSGVSTATIWEQMSTCTIAGVGGGEVVRGFLQRRQLQTQRGVTQEAIDVGKDLLDPPTE
jgi:hypothetical protein